MKVYRVSGFRPKKHGTHFSATEQQWRQRQQPRHEEEDEKEWGGKKSYAATNRGFEPKVLVY